ncbi:MAG: hypothetical protein KW806_02840 [Candidatus Yanofskybacteria bacterium]|nr:hypothetical protein [Candidatus Yanofskybacteria bacterium]
MWTPVGSSYTITNGPTNEEILAAHSDPEKGVTFFMEGRSKLYVQVSLRTILRISAEGNDWVISGVTIPEEGIMKDPPLFEVRSKYNAETKSGTFEFLREIGST